METTEHPWAEVGVKDSPCSASPCSPRVGRAPGTPIPAGICSDWRPQAAAPALPPHSGLPLFWASHTGVVSTYPPPWSPQWKHSNRRHSAHVTDVETKAQK